MTRWWGQIHAHQEMTDIQSVGISLAVTFGVICVAALTIRTLRKRKLRLASTQTLPFA
ncbi:hypothetical protein ACFFGF_05125 [Asaia lannensis]|uniref:Uncharacterized protein n=1 Tax=Asaia lannensis NBRC 102526 TaxID=1307926 RepID=A0ABT1CKR2_9PROT|nr:hypothetical protein [Asaia lannensis]MCO6160604.1 hypothetical protein [Asaia lannensis NBRC 102526]GBR02239.1 hypothetical protein AA102526_2765 [Asaia lannensis NBRC 102526]